jgi:hypothetical protein
MYIIALVLASRQKLLHSLVDPTRLHALLSFSDVGPMIGGIANTLCGIEGILQTGACLLT